eukprot:SAG31_NODE_33115_length_347_cov_1.463710_1_plen_46_part_01
MSTGMRTAVLNLVRILNLVDLPVPVPKFTVTHYPFNIPILNLLGIP